MIHEIGNKQLSLGVIGMSPGNGHPYSWSAIINGYNKKEMSQCPFPAIPAYLSKQNFPNVIIQGAQVTKIWCDNIEHAKNIALFSNIDIVAQNIEELLDVDAVLLARDDAENHLLYASIFLDAGIPIFIDKPLGYNLIGAYKLLARQLYRGQIFSCSALRYDDDLIPTGKELKNIGNLLKIQATVPKSWHKYAIHVIDPMVSHFLFSDLTEDKLIANNQSEIEIHYKFECGLNFEVKACLEKIVPITISYIGDRGRIEKTHVDAFSVFKKCLEHFIDSVREGSRPIPEKETLKIVEMIESGS